jgi:nucleoside-diphosphate-sugar epimerase
VKLLITGATGFVGRNLLLELLKRDLYQEIYLPVRSAQKIREQLKGDGYETMPASVKIVEGSAGNWNVKGLDVDHVVHSAGVIFARTRQEYFETNVEGTFSLLRELKTPKRVVILSSQSASGPCPDGEFRTEDHKDSPVTWYGESKLEMEKRLLAEHPTLNYVCLRPPMIFGARDQATLPLFKMVQKPLHFKCGFRPKFYSFIAVSDLVNAVICTLQNGEDWSKLPSRHFFVAAEKPVTDEVLIRTAAKVMKRKGLLVRVPQPVLWGVSRVIDSIPTWRATIPSLSVDRAKEIWPSRWVVSPERFSQRFGWKSEVDFETVVKETCDWYRKAGQLPSL